MPNQMPEDASTAGSDGSSATPSRCDAAAPAGNGPLRDGEAETPVQIDAEAAANHCPGGGDTAEEQQPSRFDTDVDSGLLADVLLGDERAIRVFVKRMMPVVAKAAQRAPLHIRPDAMQDAWLHLCNRNFLVLQKWKRSGPLANFVMIAARNRVFDFLRRHRDDLHCRGADVWQIEEAIRCPDELIDHNSPEQQILAFEREGSLEKAKASLSEKHRQLIILRYDRDLKLREIAEQLGRTIGAVSATLSRAENALRKKVLEACGDHLGPVVRGILKPSDDE
jgi:RNA polymerase sigma factor (sigma-70 family)